MSFGTDQNYLLCTTHNLSVLALNVFFLSHHFVICRIFKKKSDSIHEKSTKI